jgi:hypothetical protein
MAWSEQKNRIFFERCQNWASAVINLLEERTRLIAIYTNEAQGEPAFVDTPIATTAELVSLAGVMNAMDAMVNNAPVSTSNRMPLLTPFVIDKTQ